MRKYGFKIFSTNLLTAPKLIKDCADYVKKQDDMFLELMVVASSSEKDLYEIKRQVGEAEVRIHAPHHVMGFDAGNKTLEKQNREIFAKAQAAADIFNAKTIVVHAGCGHSKEHISETARQFKLFNDKRIVVENLPFMDDADKRELQCGTADEIKYIQDACGCGFCFDFSHAVCAAATLQIEVEKQLQSFYDLHPNVYHLCDGNIAENKDSHSHFGEGNYPLKHFLNDFTDEHAYITMETGHGVPQNKDLWVDDYHYLKALL